MYIDTLGEMLLAQTHEYCKAAESHSLLMILPELAVWRQMSGHCAIIPLSAKNVTSFSNRQSYV